MQFLNDLLLLPYYSFNYLFSIIVWIILFSYLLNRYDSWEYPNPITVFLYNCYELLVNGLEKIVGSAEKFYNKVVAVFKRG